MTANTQEGSFFRIMTEYEQAVIDLYNELIDGYVVRFHDALVVRESTIRDKDYVLPLTLRTSKEHHGTDFLYELIELAKKHNWQIYDSGIDGMIDLENPEKNGFENHRKYVTQIINRK